jgi:hypothetical protein
LPSFLCHAINLSDKFPTGPSIGEYFIFLYSKSPIHSLVTIIDFSFFYRATMHFTKVKNNNVYRWYVYPY